MMHRRIVQSQHRETGAALIWAIMFMLIGAALISAFVLTAQRAGERSVDAARRVSNGATVQTATTRIIYGFQSELGSDQDYYRLDRADLTQIVNAVGSTSKVYDPSQLNLPAEYRQQFGIWEHALVGGSHVLRPVAGQTVPDTVVEEVISPDAAACSRANIPARLCGDGTLRAYWQVVRIVLPDVTGADSPNVAVTIRTWLGNSAHSSWSKASYARAEMRAGRFADFQLIADGNIRFGPDARINGPIHSNGLDDGSFATVHQAPGAAPGSSWMYFDPGVTCSGRASMTLRVGSVLGSVPGSCNVQGANGQTISFLRAIDSMDDIQAQASAGRPDVRSFATGGRVGPEGLGDAYLASWRVRLQGTSIAVNYPDGTFAGTFPIGRSSAFLFDRDIRVAGNVAGIRRVTLAARRVGGGAATVFVDGNITKGDPRSSSIGLMAQGDVVLWQSPSRPCTASVIEAAMVSATGGVTIPTRYTTNEVQSDAPDCTNDIKLFGSIASHRPPTLIWTWPGGQKAGFSGSRSYLWDEALKRAPPPFFPLTGSWQPFNVRDVNIDCLYQSARLADPKCR